MKKEFNKIESTGWILFMLLMILYVLLMMAMPVPHRDEYDQLEKTWTSNGMIVLTLSSSMMFSILLIIVGRIISRFDRPERRINKVESIGWILFMLLMIPFVLLMMAHPLQYGDEPEMIWKMDWIWLGSQMFSILLIIVGRYRQQNLNFRK